MTDQEQQLLKLEAITAARRELSSALIEQSAGLRDDINEVAEQILSRLYDAGARSNSVKGEQ